MFDRRSALVAFIVLVLALAGAGWWLGSRGAPSEGGESVATTGDESDDYDPFPDDDYDRRRPRQEGSTEPGVALAGENGKRPEGASRADEGERGGRWRSEEEREAWRNDPERRRRIAARRIEIVPLGDAAPTITPERVMDTMRARRTEMRECFRSAGVSFGRERGQAAGQTPEQAAGQPTGQTADAPRERTRRSIAFDLDAQGRVTAGSTSFTPPLPEALSECLRNVVQTTAFDAPGTDGARIEMQLGGGGRRSRGRDAGVE